MVRKYCITNCLIVFFIFRLVNIHHPANTTDQSSGDVFADFDAITQGLLGNPVAERTPLNIASSVNNPHQHSRSGFAHQSQHPDKQR